MTARSQHRLYSIYRRCNKYLNYNECSARHNEPRPATNSYQHKCIGDDTKAAARQSLNCIKNK